MKTRKEIKALGKERFRANYWPCVGASLLIPLVIGLSSATVIGAILLVGPLTIGLNFFYVQNILKDGAGLGEAFGSGFENYGRKLGGYWWMILFLFLWSLIPVAGIVMLIIKSFAYAMTPYILADCPNVKAKDALKLSMRIMKGHKWQLFVFELSFIGWALLSCLTLGILNIFFTNSFMASASAAWYLEVREEALRTGAVTLGQLEGTEEV